jgi:hypothetical protein
VTAHETLTPLLDLDPDLGRLLSRGRTAEAQAELGVRVTLIPRGQWEAGRLAAAHPENVGLLLLDGMLAREVLIADTVSTELLGTGDIVRPWHEGEDASLLVFEVRWTALTDVRLAVLDRRFAARLPRFPEVNAMLLERISDRAQRVAVSQAISQLNGVDRRLLALFWHLAERWGRITTEGVAVPLTLSHRMLAQLVGARRPTVSSALADLAGRHELARRGDGTWLLTGKPMGAPDADTARIIEHRRRLLPTDIPPPENGKTPPRVFRVEDVSMRLERLRRSGQEQLQILKETRDAAAALCQRATERRARRRHEPRSNGRHVA